MSTRTQSLPSNVAAAAATRSAPLVWLAIAALGWFLFRQLSLEWSINPQYSYGWVVPVLTAYLVWKRWETRPAPGEPWRAPALFGALLFLLLPIRWLQEANPDWRFTNWLAAIVVVGILWLGILACGGKAWWRHFSFATAFVLVATPWPTPLENVFVQNLMQMVAGIGVEALNWLGIAAQQEGNLIRLAGGTLGVDEACSGVRSFQATIMASLFLGELHRLPWARRGGLVATAVALAIGLNLLRTILLAIAAGKEGLAAVQRWHDPAGYFLLAVTFLSLLALARLLGGRGGREESVEKHSPRASAGRLSAGVVMWLVFCELATIGWYRWHERDQRQAARWAVEWPFEKASISEGTRLVLRFNEGKAAVWNRPDGSRWHLFFFTWNPGRAAANLARNHRPETCLPATGFELVQVRSPQMHRIGALELPIERIEFKKGNQRLHVYYCLWEDRTPRATQGPQLINRENRVRAALEGRRHLGQRVLEVVISGIDSPERADAEFAASLAKWIKPEAM